MRKGFTIICFLLFMQCCIAGVNPRQGNFFMNYIDVEFPGTTFSIGRMYSSSTTKSGLFGYGWNSYIETRLIALPDGTLCVKWWGTGSKDFFDPIQKNNNGLFEMLNAVVENEIKGDKLEQQPLAIMQRKNRLMSDRELLAEKYLELIDQNLVKKYVPPTNATIQWIRNVNQEIQWKNGKYVLQNWKDQYEFNTIGLLTQIKEPAFEVQFGYEDQFLRSIKVGRKYSCAIQTNKKGQITQLLTKDNSGIKIASYKYDTANNLIYSKDAGNNEYWFQYDLLQNLVRISYADQTYLQVTYDAVTNRAVKVKAPNGSFTVYQYPQFFTSEGKQTDLHYGTIIERYASSGKLDFTQKQEYESREKNDGSIYLYHTLEVTDTSFEETFYDAEVGNAYYRKKNNRIGWSRYDNKSRPIYLRIQDTIYYCSYDINDRVSSFMIIDSVKNDSTKYEYAYDNNGILNTVLKNGVRYSIKGNINSVKMELNREGADLTVYLKNKKMVALQNSRWPIAVFDSTVSNKIAEVPSNVNNIPEQNETREEGADKRAAAMAQKIKEQRKAASESKEKTDVRKILMAMFVGEFEQIMEPKLIPHEWIWEKL